MPTTKITLSLSLLILLSIAALSLFATTPQAAAPAPPATRIPTPRPTPTPYPAAVILATRSQLVRHFDQRYNLNVWTEESYDDGAIRVTGQSTDGRLRLYLWTSRGAPDNLTQIYLTFRFNEQAFIRSRERENGTNTMLDTVRLAFPQWTGGGAWIRENMGLERAKMVIDGVGVYLQSGREELTGDQIIILVAIEQ